MQTYLSGESDGKYLMAAYYKADIADSWRENWFKLISVLLDLL